MWLPPVDIFCNPLGKVKLAATFMLIIVFFKHGTMIEDPYEDIQGSPLYSYWASIFSSECYSCVAFAGGWNLLLNQMNGDLAASAEDAGETSLMANDSEPAISNATSVMILRASRSVVASRSWSLKT